MRKRQLFVLPPSAWWSTTAAEVEATIAAMKDLNLYHLPYPEIDLWIPANGIFGWNRESLRACKGLSDETIDADLRSGLYKETVPGFYGPAIGSGFVFHVEGLSLSSPNLSMYMRIEPGSPAAKMYESSRKSPPGIESRPFVRDSLANLLIVLLATRNVKKVTHVKKCARLGIGTKKGGQRAYEYVTTISPPEEGEDAPHSPENPSTPGAAKRPHLRRGHIRRQLYGPERSLTRQIWIAPIFVNADADWVDARARYNVSL